MSEISRLQKVRKDLLNYADKIQKIIDKIQKSIDDKKLLKKTGKSNATQSESQPVEPTPEVQDDPITEQ